MSGNSEAIIGRHSRAIRILTCLQAGPTFNAKELAARMKVSRRTIYRDLNLIRNAGIRVRFDGESSGYKVASANPNPLTPPEFSDRDLAKIALTAQFSVLHGFPGFSASVRESMARFLAHYPPTVRESVTRLLNCCTVDLPRPRYSATLLEVVESLLTAITQHRQVRIQMVQSERGRQTVISTRFCPFRLTAALDDWWAVGRSLFHRRTIRIAASTICDIEATEEEYRIPHGFRSRLSRDGQESAVPLQIEDAG
jgi:predicted DNA-binding transcriptional regulator YafY